MSRILDHRSASEDVMEENAIKDRTTRSSVVFLVVQSRIEGTRSHAFLIARMLHEPVTS